MTDNVNYQINQPDVIYEKFDKEYVVVNLKNGSYYALKGTSAHIWRELVNGASRDEILTALQSEYAADESIIVSAVETFLMELENETLVTRQSKTLTLNTHSTPTSNPPRVPFTPPVLEKFTDMREVLQLDPIHQVDDSGWPAHKPA